MKSSTDRPPPNAEIKACARIFLQSPTFVDVLLLNFLPSWLDRPTAPRSPHCWGFVIVLRHTTLGRTPPDEWSGRLRDLYLKTYDSLKETDFRATGGIRTRYPSKHSPQNHALDLATTRIGHVCPTWPQFLLHNWYSVKKKSEGLFGMLWTSAMTVNLEKMYTWNWRNYVVSKRRDTITRWHAVIFQMNWILRFNVAKTSKVA